MSALAIHGGEKAITMEQSEALRWPIITDEEISAVVELMRKGELSISETTYKFEEEFATYHGVKHALAHNNGTAAIHAALFAVGVGPGDEVIVPPLPYWAVAMPVLTCNAVPVFCDVDPVHFCPDPKDIEKRLTPQTKAILVVHNDGMPTEMDAVMDIAHKHGLPVIEDCSRAHGATYKGKKVGTIGDIGCFSLQTSKLMIGGEGGVLITDNTTYYERAVCLGHYERIGRLPDEQLHRYASTGFGYKYRINPLAAAIARVQLKYLDERNARRNANVAYLCSAFAEMPGIEPLPIPDYIERVYYGPFRIRYRAEQLNGLPKEKFIAALQAEGALVNDWQPPKPLHLQAVFQERNLWGNGCPFDCPHVHRRVVYEPGALPVAENPPDDLIGVPAFPSATKQLLDQYILAFRKVIEHADELM